nr:hypothetical protein CFP56_54881 [Quercus suber]
MQYSLIGGRRRRRKQHKSGDVGEEGVEAEAEACTADGAYPLLYTSSRLKSTSWSSWLHDLGMIGAYSTVVVPAVREGGRKRGGKLLRPRRSLQDIVAALHGVVKLAHANAALPAFIRPRTERAACVAVDAAPSRNCSAMITAWTAQRMTPPRRLSKRQRLDETSRPNPHPNPHPRPPQARHARALPLHTRGRHYGLNPSTNGMADRPGATLACGYALELSNSSLPASFARPDEQEHESCWSKSCSLALGSPDRRPPPGHASAVASTILLISPVARKRSISLDAYGGNPGSDHPAGVNSEEAPDACGETSSPLADASRATFVVDDAISRGHLTCHHCDSVLHPCGLGMRAVGSSLLLAHSLRDLVVLNQGICLWSVSNRDLLSIPAALAPAAALCVWLTSPPSSTFAGLARDASTARADHV